MVGVSLSVCAKTTNNSARSIHPPFYSQIPVPRDDVYANESQRKAETRMEWLK